MTLPRDTPGREPAQPLVRRWGYRKVSQSSHAILRAVAEAKGVTRDRIAEMF